MVFDKVMMRWVKGTVMESPRMPEGGGGGSAEIDAESEDPFRDIESLREDSLVGDGIEGQASPLMNNSDVDDVVDEEEMELTSFSFDGPSHTHMPAASLSEDDTTDSDNDDDVTEITALSASLSLVGAPEITSDPDSSDEEPHNEHALAVVKTTLGPSREVSVPTPIRSVLKSTAASPVVTFTDPVINSHCTPANKSGHRRSVSFSDGKREGPIRGLGRSTHVDSGDNVLTGQVLDGDSPFEPSVRSKRIGEMLDGLDLESTKIGPLMYPCRLIPLSVGIDDKSPLRPANLTAGTLLPGVKHVLGTDNTSDTRVPKSDIARRVPARSQHSTSHSVTVGVGSQPNATFLTEASFGVAHDKLVQVITDLQPFEPYWEELSSIDLANKNIESVARLKEFLPRLHTLSLWVRSEPIILCMLADIAVVIPTSWRG
jgi:protein NUD1